jgi:RimJ/RimL family protein N-acetyltransferase
MSIVAPVIDTARLRLRPYEAGDLDDLADIRRRPEAMRYLYQDVQGRAEVAEVLARRVTTQRALRREGDSMVLAVELRDLGRVIGDVSIRWTSDAHRQGDIGFVFHPGYHGEGYAAEAARELLRLGFERLRFHRIEGRCDARNDASARLMERLGMRREAHFVENEWFKGEWGSELVYAILDRDWRAVTA